ncbi:MAG: 6-bladed beta-propeller [Bacteroidales bacterium]|nr:6-bladed beta-propeller [Bacteroidales bacterium]
MKNYQFLITIFIIIISCKPRQNPDYVTIDIFTNENKTLKTSCFARSVNNIMLQDPPGSVIGDIKKIRMNSSCIIALDSKLNMLLKFDHNGKLLAISSNIGKGPLEVDNMVDFYFDTINKKIEALDIAGFKLIVYDSLLNPVKKINIRMRGERNFFKLSGNKYLLFADNHPFIQGLNKTIYTVDTLGNIVESYIDNSDLLYISGAERNCINEYLNKVVFNRGLTNNIYEFNKDSNLCRLKYIINFKNYHFPNEFLDEYKSIKDKSPVSNLYLFKYIDISNTGKYIGELRDVYENDKYLVFGYHLTSTPKWYYVFYNKATKALHTGLPINDLSDETRFGKPVYMDGKRLYTAIFDEEADAYSIAIYELK